MEKLSDYISKKVISLQSGELVGYVLNAMFDESVKTLTSFVISDDENEKLFTLDYENIKSCSEDCIMIEGDFLSLYLDEETFNPVGKIVYDVGGLNLGRVIDVILQGRQVKRLVTDKCEFFQRFVRKSGKNFIIYGQKPKNKTKNIKKSVFEIKDKKLPNAYIQDINNIGFQGDKPNDKIFYTNVSSTKPYRILANQNSIIGRTMQADLYGYNNEIIAKKYDIINQNIINRAKKHNKLNFLFYYSK